MPLLAFDILMIKIQPIRIQPCPDPPQVTHIEVLIKPDFRTQALSGRKSCEDLGTEPPEFIF